MLTIGLTSFILSGCELVPLDENIESAVLERALPEALVVEAEPIQEVLAA